MAIEKDETGLTQGDQKDNLIQHLQEEIAVLQRVRDYYFKCWKAAEIERDEALAGKKHRLQAYR